MSHVRSRKTTAFRPNLLSLGFAESCTTHISTRFSSGFLIYFSSRSEFTRSESNANTIMTVINIIYVNIRTRKSYFVVRRRQCLFLILWSYTRVLYHIKYDYNRTQSTMLLRPLKSYHCDFYYFKFYQLGQTDASTNKRTRVAHGVRFRSLKGSKTLFSPSVLTFSDNMTFDRAQSNRRRRDYWRSHDRFRGPR